VVPLPCLDGGESVHTLLVLSANTSAFPSNVKDAGKNNNVSTAT
jgi:hypothetical protein